MPYSLTRLAPGSYDLHYDSRIIGSVVRTSGEQVRWFVELLRDLPPAERPAPFRELEHEFATLEEIRAWLGIAGDRNPGDAATP
ncbi:hypothetical protein [Microvirga brassicacearum]|uniref:Uncharacterized protein n=1 Tax=Microvirga brassicacearum TaxID=2580413 RepID=A0A5N3PDQ9_9HYPH|nr:hypothetical protein [Microvirga brassicacearum]KAB0267866.1 hypothetical protein FEZ63_07590 [Microvirga brassicacearum]